jgi:hypothetical protein
MDQSQIDTIVSQVEDAIANIDTVVAQEVVVTISHDGPIKEDGSNLKCTVCVSESDDQEALVKVVYNQRNTITMTKDVEGSDVVWMGRPFEKADNQIVDRLNGFINRISGTEIFREKDTQCWILNQCKKYFPESFNFHPGSYCVAKDYDMLQKDVMQSGANKLWIAKPSDGGDGDGIFLFKTMEELHANGMQDDMVIQQYIGNPLLLNKRKWDSRIYVIVHGINPMKAYISTDCGLGRFCTEEYDTSDTANIYSHLTNYSINRKSDKYVNAEEEEEESTVPDEIKFNTKMPMSAVWKLIQKEYPEADIDALKKKVIDCASNTLRSCRSAIEVKCAEMMNMNMTEGTNNKFFHVLGLDIMFDDNFDAWLFETNRFPSMDISLTQPGKDGSIEKHRSIIDEKIKGTLLQEAFKILVAKQKSDIFTQFYDSSVEGTEDHDFIYEKVSKVFKKLSGNDLKETLSVADFYKLLTIIPPECDMLKINIESYIQRMKLGEKMNLTLIDVFNGLEWAAADLDMNIFTFVDTLM